MATLYVEGVPDDLYQALRKRARERRRSMAAEVVSLLEENIPTAKTLKARRNLFKKLEKIRSSGQVSRRPFPSTEEMLREDRAR
jgi:plasmid stability protein